MARRNRGGCLKLFLAAFGIIALAAWAASRDNNQPSGSQRPSPTPSPMPPAAPDLGDTSGAWMMAKQFVEDELTAPASAEWPRKADQTFELGNGRWKVLGHVDSQNTFGAMVRTRFAVTLSTKDGRTWRLEELIAD